METQLVIPRPQDPSAITEILQALRKAHFKPTHEGKVWGDLIHLHGLSSVICIECAGDLCRAATIEHGEGEEEGEPVAPILQAFGALGWCAAARMASIPCLLSGRVRRRRLCAALNPPPPDSYGG